MNGYTVLIALFVMMAVMFVSSNNVKSKYKQGYVDGFQEGIKEGAVVFAKEYVDSLIKDLEGYK